MRNLNPRSDSYEALMFDVLSNAHRYWPKRNDQVLDLGAHFGVFALFCAARGCFVKAYEPAPEAFAELQHTAEVAKEIGFGGIECHNEAVWSKSGTGLLFQRSESSAARSMLQGHNPDNVKCVSLRDAMEEKDWSCVKVDVEGSEAEIFLNARIEDLQRIKFLTMEIHNDLLLMHTRQLMIKRLRENFPYGDHLPVKVNGVPTSDYAAVFYWR